MSVVFLCAARWLRDEAAVPGGLQLLPAAGQLAGRVPLLLRLVLRHCEGGAEAGRQHGAAHAYGARVDGLDSLPRGCQQG